MTDASHIIEQLTNDALEAARNGQWERVETLYKQRWAHLHRQSVPSALHQKVVERDTWLIARIQEAQGALKQQISDIQDQRRKLGILRRQWNGSPGREARYLLTI